MERWNRLLTRPALRSGYSGGNRPQFFTDGDRTFRAVWDDIARAEERVWMETYVYEPDAVGRRTRRALAPLWVGRRHTNCRGAGSHAFCARRKLVCAARQCACA